MRTIELTPSRELDAIIHEVRTGTRIPCTHSEVKPVRGSLVQCTGCGEEFGTTTLAIARDAWPRYTSDFLAAWELVVEERLVVFPRMTKPRSKPRWCAAPWEMTKLAPATGLGVVEFNGFLAGKADTPELAISHSYLLVKNINPESALASRLGRNPYVPKKRLRDIPVIRAVLSALLRWR